MLKIKAGPSQQTRLNNNPSMNFHDTPDNYQHLDGYVDNDPHNIEVARNSHRQGNFTNDTNRNFNGPHKSHHSHRQSPEYHDNEITNIEDTGNFFISASNDLPVT